MAGDIKSLWIYDKKETKKGKKNNKKNTKKRKIPRLFPLKQTNEKSIII